MNTKELQLISNTVKTLSMDAIEKAKSGHPGMPMGCSDIAAVLWGKILKHNPKDPNWVNRDRFILSAGHGSMLLYSMLHLTGYGLTIDDIKKFRQMGSLTPGHPEYGHTKGVETTTGPLGQGFANAVGMAVANKMLKEEFSGDDILDHYIYTITGDGDLMEGVAYEAASVAGHLGLGNLIYIFDSNDISIEGDTNLTFSEDMEKRFESCKWHVQKIDGHNFDEIEKAILNAQNEKSKPSIIIAKTKIAKGSPGKEGSESSHGAPLGADEIIETKKNIGWDRETTFHVPDEVYELFIKRNKELENEYSEWNKKFSKAISGDKKVLWDSFFSAPEIDFLRKRLPEFEIGSSVATRSAGGKIMEVLFKELPNFIGGSADLGPSNKTFVKGYSESGNGIIGRNIHFGIREHAMGAIQNGIAYYGGFIPFSATFFVFMDYMRPPIRLASLSGLNTIYVFTHDSFFVGEDGPTHQPVEHLAVARAIPGLNVIRPADAVETSEAWLAAIERTDGPTVLTLTRQNVPVLERTGDIDVADLKKGAYIIYDNGNKPDMIILASGSEVHISIDAAKKLKADGINVRVVSFPSWYLFDKQKDEYKSKIIPDGIPFTVVEAGLSMGWEKYSGNKALFITMPGFGTSAPGDEIAEHFGFSADNISQKIKEYLK